MAAEAIVLYLLDNVEDNLMMETASAEILTILQNLSLFTVQNKVYCIRYKLDDELQQFYNKNIVKSDDQIFKLCCETIKQSKCKRWYDERKLHLTASKNIHDIKVRRTKTVESLVESILNPTCVSTASTKYGIKTEPVAKCFYENIYKCEVKEVGLIKAKKNQWLCISLDGIVVQDGEIKKIVEFKCPSSCQNQPVVDLDSRRSNVKFLTFKNNNLELLKSHQYYTQCQVQLYVTGLNECDLFIYSPKGSVNITVFRDEEFLKEVISKAELFYFDHYLPALYTKMTEGNCDDLSNNCSIKESMP